MAPSSANISCRRKQTKTKMADALPIEESLSEYGQKVVKSVAVGTKSVASSRTRGLTRMSNFSSVSATSSIEEQSEKSLDRMSLNLADEDPSLLLYGKPHNIASNLGLGQAKSFQALNESLRAVKLRQNLPEAQREQLNVRDKVENDIKLMAVSKSRQRYQSSDEGDSDDDDRSSSGNSVVECFHGNQHGGGDERELSCDSEYYEDERASKKVRKTAAACNSRRTVSHDNRLLNDARESRSVAASNRSREVRRTGAGSLSRSQSRDHYSNYEDDFGDEDFDDQPPKRSQSSMQKVRSLLDDYISIKAQNEVPEDGDDSAKRSLGDTAKKPFVSRFLNKVRKNKLERDSHSDHELESERSPRRRTPPVRRSVSHNRREERERVDAKKVLRSLSRMSAREIERLDFYLSDSDEQEYTDDDVEIDDVSLARYGVVHSSSSSIASSKPPRSEPKHHARGGSRKGRPARNDPTLRGRSGQGRMSNRCSENELSDLDVDPGEPVCLDSIISKYLYKK